jgi:hypothetical protein
MHTRLFVLVLAIGSYLLGKRAIAFALADKTSFSQENGYNQRCLTRWHNQCFPGCGN